MQAFAIAGASHMGASGFFTSQLDRITRRLRRSWRTGWRSLIDTLSQPGNPL